jgi:hypothetical protein
VNDGAVIELPPGMKSAAAEFIFIDGWKLDAPIFKPPSPMLGVPWGVNTPDDSFMPDLKKISQFTLRNRKY